MINASRWQKILRAVEKGTEHHSDAQDSEDAIALKSALADAYGPLEERQRQVTRLAGMMDKFLELYGDNPVVVVSSPGRAELLGNYQDNDSLGLTLSAAIPRDVVAVAARDEEKFMAYDMKLPDPIDILMKDLPYPDQCKPHAWHNFALGIARQFDYFIVNVVTDGYPGTGAKAVIDGEVPIGSGCSSSAALENALTFAYDKLYGTNLDINGMARISKTAENLYHKKGCGYLDQLTSLVGGIVFIEYSNPKAPVATQLPRWFDSWSLVTVTVDEGHQGEDHLYNTIKPDFEVMKERMQAAILSGPDHYAMYLTRPDRCSSDEERQFNRAEFYVQERCRVLEGLACLLSGTQAAAHRFGELMDHSGDGSRDLLGNTNPAIDEAVRLAREVGGYARVHGGGFKGGPIIMTAHPEIMAEAMGARYGADKVLIHGIRPFGVREISFEARQAE